MISQCITPSCDAIFGVYESWVEIKIQKLQDEIVDIIQQNILLQSTYIDIDFYDMLEVAYQKVINEMVKGWEGK